MTQPMLTAFTPEDNLLPLMVQNSRILGVRAYLKAKAPFEYSLLRRGLFKLRRDGPPASPPSLHRSPVVARSVQLAPEGVRSPNGPLTLS
eukprot:s1406_g1.t1